MELKIGTMVTAPSVTGFFIKGEIVNILTRVVVVAAEGDHYVVKKDYLLNHGYTISDAS